MKPDNASAVPARRPAARCGAAGASHGAKSTRGRARHGSRRSPIWRTGGVTFGPHPRDYHVAMPRKMWRKAMFSALSAKAQSNQLLVITGFPNEKISTKEQVAFLDLLGVATSALYVTNEPTEELLLSIRNLPGRGAVYAAYR